MRSLGFNLYFYALTAVLALAGAAVAWVGAASRVRPILHLWTRGVLWGVRWILRGRVQILGRENLPPDGRPALLVSKHQSELDAIVLLNLFPDLGAVAMQELERYPFVGPVIRALGYILVPVSGPPAGRTAAVVEGAQRVHAAGRPVLIYPEGTLMSLGARERYRSGAWRIYAALGVPATPVAMSVGVIWPRREWRKTAHAQGSAAFLPPIPAGLDQDAFMARLEETIETGTMALIAADAAPAVQAAAQARARGDAA